jgi:hypothetical protein
VDTIMLVFITTFPFKRDWAKIEGR